MTMGVEHELHALPWTSEEPAAHAARAAMYMTGMQAEAGYACPITMTFAVVPALRAQPELAAEWEPLVTATTYDPRSIPAAEKGSAIAGMAMTEKQGGSDVRANTTFARPLNGGGAGAEYQLTGHKWFCSAPMSDLFLVLAQAESADGSAEGLSCFLMPRILPDGTRNAMHIQRLKDKLGNRSNASSEIELHNAWAQMVGEPGRGVPTIIEMVGHTRLDCVIGAAAGMRAAVVQATHHAAHRAAFGKTLIDQPLMRNVLADLCLESEAATALAMRLARAYDEAGNDAREGIDDSDAQLFKRVATAVGKYWACKRAPNHAFEAMECLGGNGYVEDSGMPRLYREAPLTSIWEGSGNVISLDVLRALSRSPRSLEVFLAEVSLAQGADARLDAHVRAIEGPVRRPRHARVARAARGRRHGPGAAGLAARAGRAAGRRRRLLRRAPRRRRGPRVRHAASRIGLRDDHRAQPAAGVAPRHRQTGPTIRGHGRAHQLPARPHLRDPRRRRGSAGSSCCSSSSSSSRRPTSTKCSAARSRPPIWSPSPPCWGSSPR